MRIEIKKIRISNFRNINNLEFEFDNKIVKIRGKNGVGKTNILSAIMWCLFGKNIYEEKQFVISPIIDNEEKNEILTNVTLYFSDGYVISRSYCNNKTQLQDGYLIDGKEELTNITQLNFAKNFSSKYVDEETYKSLSNITYIPNLHWKDLKKLIFGLIGEVKDEDILLQDNFSKIEEQIKLMGIEKTQESLNNTSKSLNDTIERLEVSYQTLNDTKEKYVINNNEFSKLEAHKMELENQVKEFQNLNQQNERIMTEITKLNRDKINIENDINNLEHEFHFAEKQIEEYKELYEKNSLDVDLIRTKEKRYYQDKIEEVKEYIEQLTKQNKMYSDNLAKIDEEGNKLKNKEIKVENDTCSVCGQVLPKEIIARTLGTMKENQIKELERLQALHDESKKVIEINEKEIIKKCDEIKELEELLVKCETKVYATAEEETEKQKEIRVHKEQLELKNKDIIALMQSKEIEKQNIEEEILLTEKDLIEINPIDEVIKELNAINEKLATTITLQKIQDDIKEIENQLQEARDNKNSVNLKLQQVVRFNNLKADLTRKKARDNFKLTDFITREYTNDGREIETFKICVDGIEYKELNTGKKMLVAIDLVTGIQRLKNIYVPIIIDNFEQLTSDLDLEVDTQIIIAEAVKNIDKLEVL